MRSKNHVVCARCHFVGLASGIDCTERSSAESGSAMISVSLRVWRYWRRSCGSGDANVWGEDASDMEHARKSQGRLLTERLTSTFVARDFALRWGGCAFDSKAGTTS